MIEDEIAKLVREHYQPDNARLLMLSNLGARLTREGLWPQPNDRRTLHEAAEATPGIRLIRDPDASSFIGVVLEGEEQRVEDAIAERKKRAFLRDLPRAFLLAFTLDLPDGQRIFLRLEPKPSFSVGTGVDAEGFIEVDQDLRVPGLPVYELSEIGLEDAEQLERGIRRWCEKHGIDPRTLPRRPLRAVAPVPQPKGLSALERLYSAQEADVAKRLSVPIDIALALSRMP